MKKKHTRNSTELSQPLYGPSGLWQNDLKKKDSLELQKDSSCHFQQIRPQAPYKISCSVIYLPLRKPPKKDWGNKNELIKVKSLVTSNYGLLHKDTSVLFDQQEIENLTSAQKVILYKTCILFICVLVEANASSRLLQFDSQHCVNSRCRQDDLPRMVVDTDGQCVRRKIVKGIHAVGTACCCCCCC